MTLVRYHGMLCAADLPEWMTDIDPQDRYHGRYRFPLLQLVADWNRGGLYIWVPMVGVGCLFVPGLGSTVCAGLVSLLTVPAFDGKPLPPFPCHDEDVVRCVVVGVADPSAVRAPEVGLGLAFSWWDDGEDDPALDSAGPDDVWPTDPARVDNPPLCCHTDPQQVP